MFQIAAVSTLLALGSLAYAQSLPACVVQIKSGKSFGPIKLGSDLKALRKAVVIDSESEHPAAPGEKGKSLTATAGLFRISVRDDLVREVWVEDARKLAGCLEIDGERVDRQIPISQIPKTFKNCVHVTRKGGNFFRCNDDTLSFGYGRGGFLQVRGSDKTWVTEQNVDLMVGH